jgi:hypothetical protein
MNMKAPLLLSALLPFIFSSHTSASTGVAVKFYQSPRSLFASGEVNLRDLEKQWQQDFSESSFLVERDHRQFWVTAESVARDLNLSEWVIHNRTQIKYKVIRTQGSSVLVEAQPNQVSVWMPMSELSPVLQDLGAALTITTTQLREAATWKSNSILSLPANSRLQILQYQDTWALVSFQSMGQIKGWVDLNNLLLKSDFAAFALTDAKTWLPVQYREGSDLITQDQKKISLSKVRALKTKPNLAVSLVTDDSQKLLLRQSLTLLRTEDQLWSLSKISGHGSVYWKKAQARDTEESLRAGDLSIDDLLKREVVSVSFHPKNPNIGVVSAQGIYLTVDGKSWRPISEFKKQNHPVLIDASSTVYVGTQRSFNLGKTFSAYLKMDQLTHLIETRQKTSAVQLKIRDLSSPHPGILKVELETNAGKISLAARTALADPLKWDFD